MLLSRLMLMPPLPLITSFLSFDAKSVLYTAGMALYARTVSLLRHHYAAATPLMPLFAFISSLPRHDAAAAAAIA